MVMLDVNDVSDVTFDLSMFEVFVFGFTSIKMERVLLANVPFFCHRDPFYACAPYTVRFNILPVQFTL